MTADVPESTNEPSRPKAGGHATATLNHLVGPAPLEEYAKLVREEEQLIERLSAVAHDRMLHELALRAAGVTRDQLILAVREAIL